jgi:hypothetical protein
MKKKIIRIEKIIEVEEEFVIRKGIVISLRFTV